MTGREKANSGKEGFLASLGMTIVSSDDLFGMTGLGERLARAMIPPLRGGKKRRLSGRDDIFG
jgi:hypothetical protein